MVLSQKDDAMVLLRYKLSTELLGEDYFAGIQYGVMLGGLRPFCLEH